jgi:hypothetical protein
MIFTYNGYKTKDYESFASGCSVFIALAAIIGIISVNGLSNISENSIELSILLFITVMLFYNLLKKKSKAHQQYIKIEKDILLIATYKISLKDLHFDTYNTDDGKFSRYHIWDAKGACSFYSVFEDDLSKYLTTTTINQNVFEENHSNHSDEHITASTENRKLRYNLETGFYIITEGKTVIKEVIPSVYCYDGRFTLTV